MNFKFKKIFKFTMCTFTFAFCSSIFTTVLGKPLIISINGLDGSGKTTQTYTLQNDSQKLDIYVPKELCRYYKHPLDFKWWFKSSTIDEFCDNFYYALYLRKQETLKSTCKFAVFDKGIKTIDARIIANFLCRGIDIQDINKTIKKFKEKYNLDDNDEDIKIFLQVKDNTKRIIRDDDPNSKDAKKSSYYSKYQNVLKIILENQLKSKCFIIINAEKSIEDVHKDILENIFKINGDKFDG